MKNDTYLYTHGLDTARREGDIALWWASHQANIACKKAIEESIRQGFDGMHLKADCAKEVVHGWLYPVDEAGHWPVPDCLFAGNHIGGRADGIQ